MQTVIRFDASRQPRRSRAEYGPKRLVFDTVDPTTAERRAQSYIDMLGCIEPDFDVETRIELFFTAAEEFRRYQAVLDGDFSEPVTLDATLNTMAENYARAHRTDLQKVKTQFKHYPKGFMTPEGPLTSHLFKSDRCIQVGAKEGPTTVEFVLVTGQVFYRGSGDPPVALVRDATAFDFHDPAINVWTFQELVQASLYLDQHDVRPDYKDITFEHSTLLDIMLELCEDGIFLRADRFTDKHLIEVSTRHGDIDTPVLCPDPLKHPHDPLQTILTMKERMQERLTDVQFIHHETYVDLCATTVLMQFFNPLPLEHVNPSIMCYLNQIAKVVINHDSGDHVFLLANFRMEIEGDEITFQDEASESFKRNFSVLSDTPSLRNLAFLRHVDPPELLFKPGVMMIPTVIKTPRGDVPAYLKTTMKKMAVQVDVLLRPGLISLKKLKVNACINLKDLMLYFADQKFNKFTGKLTRATDPETLADTPFMPGEGGIPNSVCLHSPLCDICATRPTLMKAHCSSNSICFECCLRVKTCPFCRADVS